MRRRFMSPWYPTLMKERYLSRRDLLVGSAAAAASFVLGDLIPSPAEAQEGGFRYFSTQRTPETLATLESDKRNAATTLRDGIPNIRDNRVVNFLREKAGYLEQESQMEIPDRETVEKVLGNAGGDIAKLAKKMERGGHGVFIYADVADDGSRIQKLFVLKRNDDDGIQFLRSYLVSMGAKGFGNEEGSNKTPLGLFTILGGRRGFFGEVVSAEQKYAYRFDPLVVGGRRRSVVKSFGENPDRTEETDEERDIAEVVTDRYTIDDQRGIHIHGTNRSGYWSERVRRWMTFLGGRRLSGGCIRMANTDIRDLGRFLGRSGYKAGANAQQIMGEVAPSNLPVAIFATARAKNEVTTRAPRRIFTPWRDGKYGPPK